MSEDKLIFSSIQTKEDFFFLLNESINTTYLNEETYPLALYSLKNLSKSPEKRFISFLHYLDKHFNYARQTQKNKYHKIPIALSAAIYLYNSYDQIKDYKNQELFLLAKYSIFEELSFYELAPKLIPQELLNLIISKSPNYFVQEEILYLVNQKLLNQTNLSAIMNYLTITPTTDLLKEAVNYDKQSIEECDNDASRRF